MDKADEEFELLAVLDEFLEVLFERAR